MLLMLRELALIGPPNLISVCLEHSNSAWLVLLKLTLISRPKLNIRTEIEANIHNLVRVYFFFLRILIFILEKRKKKGSLLKTYTLILYYYAFSNFNLPLLQVMRAYVAPLVNLKSPFHKILQNILSI